MNVSPSLPPVLTAKANGVLTVTLNRPESRNALSESLMKALQLALDEAVEDKDVKVVVLAAKGPVFSAGHDLKELTARRKDPDRGLDYYRAIFAQCSRLMQTIVRHPRPVIAQVQGVATAAGCQLVATCDLAVASTDARFATPGVNIGLFCSTPMVALSRVVPRKAALEMLFTGEPIDAHEAPPHRARQSRGRAGGSGEGNRHARPLHREQAHGDPEARQARVPAPARAWSVERLRLCRRSHGAEHAARRSPGRHRRVSAKAPAQMAGGITVYPQYSDALIARILRSVKTIAMVGASPNEVRPSFFAMKYLTEKGFKVIPVNPTAVGQEILGQKVYAKVSDLPAPVDMVDIFRNSEAAGPITDEVIANKDRLGVKILWMQLGVINEEAAKRAEAAGLTVIMNRCPKIEYGRLSGEIGWYGVNRRTIDNRKPYAFAQGGSLRRG